MTPAGALIVLMCFVGPVLPPIIGWAVGGIYDAFKVKRESLDVRTRRQLSEQRLELETE